MKRLIDASVLLTVAMLCLATFSPTGGVWAETLVGSNADNRLTVALAVRSEAVQAWLPAPWRVEPLSKGPFKGYNLGIVFIDRLLNQGPAGV